METNNVKKLAAALPFLLLALLPAILPVLATEGEAESQIYEWTDTADLFQAGSFTAQCSDPDAVTLYDADSTETQLYERLLAGMQEKQASIDIRDLQIPFDDDGQETVRSVFSSVVNDNPELFYVLAPYGYYATYVDSLQGYYWATVAPTYDDYYTKERMQALEDSVDTALAQVSDDMTDLEKMLVLHDYLVLHCAYDWEVATTGTTSNERVYNAYGALVDGDAVCQGYAEAYMLLLNKVGIDCVIVPSDEMNHAWNLVKLDGAWYHVDATWDDPTPNVEGMVSHTFFLLSDATISNNSYAHRDWTTDLKCTDTTYESGYAFNSVYSQFYRMDDIYYYMDGFSLYAVGSELQTGVRVATIGGNASPIMTCFTDGAAYCAQRTYDDSGTEQTIQIVRCDLASGSTARMGSAIAFDASASDDGYYDPTSDRAGIRLSRDGSQIEVVSCTRQTVVAAVDAVSYPASWDSTKVTSGTAAFAGATVSEDMVTVGIWWNSGDTSSTAMAAFYQDNKLVAVHLVDITSKSGLQIITVRDDDLPTWNEVRVFLTSAETYAPLCESVQEKSAA
jgi:hypothetical protein